MSKFEERLKGVPPRSVVILEIPPEENQMRLTAEFLKFERKDKVIYISSNRPANNLIEKLLTYNFDLKEAIEAGRICIIDLVSRSVGYSEVKGCIYVSSPTELSATQMAIENAVARIDASAVEPSTWI